MKRGFIMSANAMYKLTYGLFVVTSFLDGKDNGCITNTVSQVTTSPNRISLTVNKNNFTHDIIVKSGIFTASVISQEADFSLFKHFGFQSGRNVDKFQNFSDCKRADNGTLYITKGTNAYISAKVCQTIDLGTHSMFIADVTETGVLNEVPSADYSYYHANIKPKPEAVSKTSDGQTVWRCKICGYEYVGEELPDDYICPLCKHPASDFEKVTDKLEPVGTTDNGKTIWRCSVCGYEFVGDELPDDFVCPICSQPASVFEKK